MFQFICAAHKEVHGNDSHNEDAAALLLSAASARTQEKCHKEETVSSLTLTLVALATFSHVGHGCS